MCPILLPLFLCWFSACFCDGPAQYRKTAAINAGLTQAQLLAKTVEGAVIVFAVLITMETLNITPRIIELIISIVLASFGLAFALAFGFGCQDIARKAINDIVEKFKAKG